MDRTRILLKDFYLTYRIPRDPLTFVILLEIDSILRQDVCVAIIVSYPTWNPATRAVFEDRGGDVSFMITRFTRSLS